MPSTPQDLLTYANAASCLWDMDRHIFCGEAQAPRRLGHSFRFSYLVGIVTIFCGQKTNKDTPEITRAKGTQTYASSNASKSNIKHMFSANMTTAIEHLGAKIYLIHAPLIPRPFLTTVPFVASDFASWGYRVDQHASNSPYIAEVRTREKLEHEKRRGREVSQRTKLMELWAREIVERRRIEREVRKANATRPERTGRSLSVVTSPFGYPDARMKRTGAFVHDFLNAFVELDESEIPRTKQPATVSPQESRVCEHVRHLYAVRYVPNAPLPEWTHPSITYADLIVLEYRPNKNTEHSHFLRALGQAIGKNEKRMGKVESCTGTGVTKVFLWIEVGDVASEANRQGDAGDWDPVPKYERGEGPPAYV